LIAARSRGTLVVGEKTMGEMIRFKRPDGQECPAYLATPQAGDAAPAVVVIQEWWGLNAQIKSTADRLAADGFRALVPDLFRGKLAADAAEASHMMSSLNFGDAAAQDIRGAMQHVKHTSKKVAAMGFCMGGALTIIVAANVPETDAGVCFYGMPPSGAADPGKIAVPMIYHFATNDDWCTRERVGELEAEAKLSKAPNSLYRYEAQHAFMNEARPEVYDATNAKLAWDRSLEFLRKYLA
jgi:carboxymethylenebutenolidase